MTLTGKQRGVLGGMMLGLAATLLALALAIAMAPKALLPDSAASAIVHALHWEILLALWLAVYLAWA